MSVMHKPAGEQYLLTYASIRKFFPPITTSLLLIQIGLYIAGSMSESSELGILSTLAFTPAAALGQGFLWQFFTYQLVAAAWPLVLNGLALICFASRLERMWGRSRYIIFLLLMSALTAIPFIFIGLPIAGDFPWTVAAMGAFGFAFRRQFVFLFTYRIPVPAYIIAALAILMIIYLRPIAYFPIFLAAPWGYLYARIMEMKDKNRAYVVPKRKKDEGRFTGLDLGD